MMTLKEIDEILERQRRILMEDAGDGTQKQAKDPTPPADNWIHRSRDMTCRTCMYFVEKANNLTRPGRIIGRCRERSPTMKGWPPMFPSDWCGDHKIDENKI